MVGKFEMKDTPFSPLLFDINSLERGGYGQREQAPEPQAMPIKD